MPLKEEDTMPASKDKPRTIARKPSAVSASPEALETFLDGGSDTPAKRLDGPKKEKKVSTPLIIPPALKAELEKHIESLGTGTSRSIWICEAIREKLDRDAKAGR